MHDEEVPVADPEPAAAEMPVEVILGILMEGEGQPPESIRAEQEHQLDEEARQLERRRAAVREGPGGPCWKAPTIPLGAEVSAGFEGDSISVEALWV